MPFMVAYFHLQCMQSIKAHFASISLTLSELFLAVRLSCERSMIFWSADCYNFHSPHFVKYYNGIHRNLSVTVSYRLGSCPKIKGDIPIILWASSVGKARARCTVELIHRRYRGVIYIVVMTFCALLLSLVIFLIHYQNESLFLNRSHLQLFLPGEIMRTVESSCLTASVNANEHGVHFAKILLLSYRSIAPLPSR